MKKKLKKIYLQKKKRYQTNKFGTLLKPRLSIFKSNKHIYVQLIDDINANTIISSSTLDKELFLKKKSIKTSFLIGNNIALKSKLKNITNILFDRRHNKYIGSIKSLITGARISGLQI